MDSFFFYALDDWYLIKYGEYEYLQMSTLDSGVCTNSDAMYQTFQVPPETRDGSYNTNEEQCNF